MKVSILGTGAYGIALASIISNNGYDISCYTKFEEEKNELLKTRKQKGLGEYLIPESIEITTDIKECLEDTELIVLALPSSFSESILEEVVKLSDKPILIATKGILDDGRFLSEVLEDLGRDNYGVISGPSFAIDIVNGDTIGLSLATKTLELKEFFKKVFMNEKVKIRSTKDVIGVELCGTLKNIFAIESGILTGLGTDGYTHDMIESYKVANILHKHHLCTGTAAWAEVPKMLFENNPIMANRYFDIPLGKIKEGYAADVIVTDYYPHTPMDQNNINGNILFGMNGRSVVTTIGNGKILMKDRVLTMLDEEKTLSDIAVKTKKLWDKINK